MTVRDSITRARARTPGAEATPPPRRCTNEPSSRHSAGLPRSPRSARKADTNHHQPVYAGSRLKPADVREGAAPTSPPPSRIGENPPYGMIGRVEETSASFEARSAPRLYPTERLGGNSPGLLGLPCRQSGYAKELNLGPLTEYCCHSLSGCYERGRFLMPLLGPPATSV